MQRLDAFDIFLSRHPEWLGKVTYLQIAPKNRSEIPDYIELEQAAGAAAGRINGKYGEVSWTPIRYVNRVYSRSALAGLYRSARVGAGHPLRDGMNLVAKEYIAAQDPDDPGVLILSRFAGAAVECKRRPACQPLRSSSVAAAMAQALTMSRANGAPASVAALMAAISEYSIDKWQKNFLGALANGDNALEEVSECDPDDTGQYSGATSRTTTSRDACGQLLNRLTMSEPAHYKVTGAPALTSAGMHARTDGAALDELPEFNAGGKIRPAGPADDAFIVVP